MEHKPFIYLLILLYENNKQGYSDYKKYQVSSEFLKITIHGFIETINLQASPPSSAPVTS